MKALRKVVSTVVEVFARAEAGKSARLFFDPWSG
jgi:hypothetical protein